MNRGSKFSLRAPFLCEYSIRSLLFLVLLETSKFVGLATAKKEGAIVTGEGISIAAVGIPSRIEIQLLDEYGRNKTHGGEGERLLVFSSPPPLSGTIKVCCVDMYLICWLKDGSNGLNALIRHVTLLPCLIQCVTGSRRWEVHCRTCSRMGNKIFSTAWPNQRNCTSG